MVQSQILGEGPGEKNGEDFKVPRGKGWGLDWILRSSSAPGCRACRWTEPGLDSRGGFDFFGASPVHTSDSPRDSTVAVCGV